ncbi:cyclic nucleotide-binding-like protein, partial [Catenaria anguillulae PL171]
MGHLISDLPSIRAYYLRGSFKIHVIAAFPLAHIIRPFAPPLVVALAQLLPILHVRRWYRLVKRKEMSIDASRKFTLFVFFLTVCQVVHWATCGWWIMQVLLRAKPDTWSRNRAMIDLFDPFFDENPYARYPYLAQFILNVMLTREFGYTWTRNGDEVIALSIMSLIGDSMIVLYVALFVSYLANSLEAQTKVAQDIQIVQSYMKFHGIADEARKRVSQYYQQMWRSQQGRVKTDELFDDAPMVMRSEIAYKACGSYLRKVPMFSRSSDSLIRMLAIRTGELFLTPGESIIKKGDLGHDMYIIRKGIAQVVSDDQTRVWAELGEFSFFGEISLFHKVPRTTTVVALTPCQVFTLHRVHLNEVLRHFPEEEIKIRDIVSQRLAEITRINEEKRLNPQLSQQFQFRS